MKLVISLQQVNSKYTVMQLRNVLVGTKRFHPINFTLSIFYAFSNNKLLQQAFLIESFYNNVSTF